ncbi:MAG: GAF domain-containing protein [Blastocatellia bacterium]|nr:GAF domain-containing protein [Blastocatellia bacterium]
MVAFQYQKISKDFIKELGEKISSGESMVLLGPRYGGKRYVIFRLRELLKEEAGPVVYVRFLEEPSIITEKQALEVISKAVSQTAELSTNDFKENDFLGPLDRLYSQSQKPVILLAANVDGLAYNLARRFLEGVRTRVESGRMIAVLSGEDDFRDLVYGPKSEFISANQFVLQGYELDEFEEYLGRYQRNLHVTFESHKEMVNHLWELTGGNAYLLRVVLWALLESRARTNTSPNKPIKIEDIPDKLKTIGIPGVYGAHIFRQATQLIDRGSKCWEDLEKLIKGETVNIGLGEGAPGRLELAGVAVRDISTDKAQLQMSSPLMKAFIQRHYTDRRFGDLYARIGQWNKAFERYDILDQKGSLRPLGIDDRAEVEATINALCASLYSEATKSIESVKKLFIQGCHYILGFEEITFWQRETRPPGAGWQPLLPNGSVPDKNVVEQIATLLSLDNSLSPGPLPLPDPWNKYAAAAILPTLRSDKKVAVVVGDMGKKVVISRERERLVKQALEHFIKVYTRAVSVDVTQMRLEVRDKHVEIMNSIFDSLGRNVLDVRNVLAMAARGLRKLGYSRVLFCLVDPERKRIQGVLDDSDDPSVNVAEMTDWPLDDPTADLQPYIIHTKKPKIIADASQEPLANKEVVRRARMKAVAIVPILNRDGDAIGTIHVEREDEAVPSEDEVRDLMTFGRQLATAIEQSERVNLLESALDKIPEPIVIVGRNERPRYANRPAAELFGLQDGWIDHTAISLLSGPDAHNAAKLVHESLLSGHRLVHHVKGIGKDSGYRGAVLSDIIQDWRKRTVGGLLHIQDLNYLYKVFESLRLIAEAKETDSAVLSILEATKLLGHKWGRLYLLDKDDPDKLVSVHSFGYTDPIAESEFNQGKVVLPPRNEPGHEHWWPIERKTPLVFCWKKDVEIGKVVITSRGLKAINVNPQKSPGQIMKKPGDFWIDFPLMTQEKALGKLCIQGDESLRPEDFELLKVLSEKTSELLDAFFRRDRDFDEREQLIRVSAAQKIMADMSHNIATRLAALPVVLSRYRMREETLSSLKEVNDDFAHIMDETLSIIKRVKERLTSVVPHLELLDIVAQMERTLRSSLPDDTWTLAPKHPIDATIDSHLLEMALLELIQNSKDMAEDHKNMRISVSVESVQTDSQDWVRIIYRDNGPGLPEAFREKIFEDFFSHRPGRKASIGLGLGFVRRVVEAHAGVINLGMPDEGAEFVIAIPILKISNQTKEGSYVSHSDS